MVNRLLTALIVAMVLVLAGAVSGFLYRTHLYDSSNLRQIGKDERKADKLEEVSRGTKARVEQKIKVIRETVDDCLHRRAPQPVIDGLRVGH